MAVTAIAALTSHVAWSAPSSPETAEKAALSQCVSMRTTGADRILTARWLFAVMSRSPQIADLSAVTAERTKELDQGFAKLITRLVTKDCIDEIRPIAARDLQEAFEEVGGALGDTAMTELMSGQEVDKGVGAYADYITDDDLKALTDSLPKKTR